MDFDEEEDRRVLQALFDKAYLGLESQGFKRSTYAPNGGRCQYRGADGRKCAVGWLIPDEHYAPQIEGALVAYLVPRGERWSISEAIEPDTGLESLREALEASGVPATPGVTQLLRALQRAHDYPEHPDPDGVEAELGRVAERFGLTVPNAL